MKLVHDPASVWPTHMVDGYPFGVESIGPRDHVVFRLWGSRRIYLRDQGFISRAQAAAYLEPIVENYKNSIIVAVSA